MPYLTYIVRWNSTYYMLKRFKKLRFPVERFLRKHEPSCSEKGFKKSLDSLTDDDWDDIDRYLKLLKPFEEATKRLQGNTELSGFEGSYGALWEVLPTLQGLFDHLKDQEQRVEHEDSHLKSGILMGLSKLDTYFGKLLDETPYYVVATALQPSLGIGWFKYKWRQYPEWKQKAESIFKRFWLRISKSPDGDSSQAIDPRCEPPRKKRRRNSSSSSSEDFLLKAFEVDEEVISDPRDPEKQRATEYNKWLKFRPSKDFGPEHKKVIEDPLRWWIDELHHHPTRFPQLGKTALDLLSCPAMSAECERVFSRAKKLITDERSRLAPETIEANELQKDWLRKGLVESHLPREEREQIRERLARQQRRTNISTFFGIRGRRASEDEADQGDGVAGYTADEDDNEGGESWIA